MFSNLINGAQARLQKRQRYNRLVNEIMSLSEREITDLRADRGEMLRHVRREIYG